VFKNICWVNWLFAAMVIFLGVISISAALSGCGNKGDLYLPDNASKTPTNPDKK
jgi:predicted small lipoprotein YifL